MWLQWFRPVISGIFRQSFLEYGFEAEPEMIELQTNLCMAQLMASFAILKEVPEPVRESHIRTRDQLFGQVLLMVTSDTPDAREVVCAINELMLMQAAIAVACYTTSCVLCKVDWF